MIDVDSVDIWELFDLQMDEQIVKDDSISPLGSMIYCKNNSSYHTIVRTTEHGDSSSGKSWFFIFFYLYNIKV